MTSEQIQDARDWCADAFTDYHEDASDAYVTRVIECMYDGGVAGFLADSEGTYIR